MGILFCAGYSLGAFHLWWIQDSRLKEEEIDEWLTHSMICRSGLNALQPDDTEKTREHLERFLDLASVRLDSLRRDAKNRDTVKNIDAAIAGAAEYRRQFPLVAPNPPAATGHRDADEVLDQWSDAHSERYQSLLRIYGLEENE